MARNLRILKPDDVMTFGKNKGISLGEIYKYQPSYIEWLILNTDHIAIDVELFKKLPDPTRNHYSTPEQERAIIENLRNAKSLFEQFMASSLLDNSVHMNVGIIKALEGDRKYKG